MSTQEWARLFFRMGPDRAKGASLNPLYGGNVAKAKSRAHGVPTLDAGWTITHPSHIHRVARGRKMGRSTPRRPPRPKPNTIWQPGHAHCPPHPQSSTASKVLSIGTRSPARPHPHPATALPSAAPVASVAVAVASSRFRPSRCRCLVIVPSPRPLPIRKFVACPPIPRRPPCSPLIVWRIDRPLLATPLDTPCRCAAPHSPPSLRPRRLPRRVRAHREKPWRRSRS